MKKKLPYDIESGFMDNLQRKLLEIPDRKESGVTLSGRIFPKRIVGMAVAAVALAALLVVMLVDTKSPSCTAINDNMLAENATRSDSQTEQIVKYLEDSGVSVYQLAEYDESPNQ